LAQDDWVRVALHRIPRALRRGRYASMRQLEMKISEAGPGDQRANPIHLREALNALVENGDVRPDHPPSPRGVTLPTFYMPRDFSGDRAEDVARRADVLALYGDFLRAARQDGGKTLERAVYKAALGARRAGHYLHVLGSPDRPPDAGVVLNDVPIGEALDLILVSADGLCAVEDKNLREWLTPSSSEVWALIGKALRHDGLPVMICRKVTWDVFLLFKQVGGLAFPVHTQMFPADYAARLARAKHRHGLGFHDLRFGDDPPSDLVRFLERTVPRNLADKLALFRANADLLRQYAIDAELESDELPGDVRARLYREFFREMKGWDADVPPGE